MHRTQRAPKLATAIVTSRELTTTDVLPDRDLEVPSSYPPSAVIGRDQVGDLGVADALETVFA